MSLCVHFACLHFGVLKRTHSVWKILLGSGGIRTHAPEETGALIQRLRPLGHATTCTHWNHCHSHWVRMWDTFALKNRFLGGGSNRRWPTRELWHVFRSADDTFFCLLSSVYLVSDWLYDKFIYANEKVHQPQHWFHVWLNLATGRQKQFLIS